MTALPAAAPLAELTALDPDTLYVFVAGPGTGEGIAVALPPRGWLLLDGCRCDGPEPLPLRAIVERWRRRGDDPVDAMVLTHPHEDHAKGFAELMDAFDPRVVGVTGVAPSEGSPGLDLAAFARTPAVWRSTRSAVYQALLAIDARFRRDPERICALNAPDRLPLIHDDAICHVCGPAADPLARVWPDGDPRLGANRLSVVLTLEFGASHVVLAADLPRVSTASGQPVPTGWHDVMARHPSLAEHTGLKLPHHGSSEAIDDTLMAPPPRHRAWVVTPYASSDLPRGDAFDDLLARQSPIHLTAPSQSRRYQAAAAQGCIAPVDPAALAELTAGLRHDGLFELGEQHLVAGTGARALDHVWCVGFDRAGRVVGRWGGGGACEVVGAAG